MTPAHRDGTGQGREPQKTSCGSSYARGSSSRAEQASSGCRRDPCAHRRVRAPPELKVAAAAPSLRGAEGSQSPEFGLSLLSQSTFGDTLISTPPNFRRALSKHSPCLKPAVLPHPVNHSQGVWRARVCHGCPLARTALLSWGQAQSCVSDVLLTHGHRRWWGRSQRPASATAWRGAAAVSAQRRLHGVYHPSVGFVRIRKLISSTCIKD